MLTDQTALVGINGGVGAKAELRLCAYLMLTGAAVYVTLAMLRIADGRFFRFVFCLCDEYYVRGDLMFDDEKERDDTMEAIDPDEYKKFLDGSNEENDILNDMLNPIEVKSTRHIEIQKEQEKKEEVKQDVRTAVKEVFDWVETLIMAMIFIIVLFTFLIRVNTVQGESMLPTLQDGQKLLVTDLFYTPNYNDIVIVQAAKLDGGKPIIKRVIGLPGDRISIDFIEGTVYRNGEALKVEMQGTLIYEDGHRINDRTTKNLEMINRQEYTVPENCYFVLGDNRNHSTDSRALNSVGFVDKNYIAGRAIFSIFPFNSIGMIE